MICFLFKLFCQKSSKDSDKELHSLLVCHFGFFRRLLQTQADKFVQRQRYHSLQVLDFILNSGFREKAGIVND